MLMVMAYVHVFVDGKEAAIGSSGVMVMAMYVHVLVVHKKQQQCVRSGAMVMAMYVHVLVADKRSGNSGGCDGACTYVCC